MYYSIDEGLIEKRSLLTPSFVLTKKFGIGPDFQVMTGVLKALSLPEAGDKSLVRMRGSSTIFDLQQDCMMLSALQSMRECEPGLTLWLNHSYNVPEDVFGKLYSQPEIQVDGSIADLWLTGEAILSCTRAVETYNLITREMVRLGCSIGCIILEWSFANPDDEWNSPILIHKVLPLEWSIVGIPANQRSWVENGIKGLFAKSLVEGKGDEALRLAAAYKSLFPRNYDDVVRQVRSTGLKKDLESVPMRGTVPRRVYFDYPQDAFVLSEFSGATKSLSRKETNELFLFPEVNVPLALAAADKTSVEQKTAETISEAKGEKSIEEEMAVDKKQLVTPKEGVADTENAGVLIRQDLGENPPGSDEQQQNSDAEPTACKAAADVTVSEDGTHEACTGSHSHDHKSMGSQGSDEQHKHTHTHKGDAGHDHNHDEKSGAELLDKQSSAIPPTTPDQGQGNHAESELTSSSNSSPEASQAQNEETAPENQNSSLEEVQRTLEAESPMLSVRLSLWNDLAKDMGLPPSNLEAVKAYLLQKRTGNEVSPALLWGQVSADGEGGKTEETSNLTTKDGREFSEKNGKVLDMVHEALFGANGMYPSACGTNQGQGEGNNQDDQGEKGLSAAGGEVLVGKTLELKVDSAQLQQAIRASVDEQLGMVNKQLQGLIDQVVKELQGLVNSMVGGVQNAEKQLVNTRAEQRVLTEQLGRLARMPLGNPTQIQRSVTSGEEWRTASYHDMLQAGSSNAAANATTLAELEPYTQLVEKSVPQAEGGSTLMPYRHWPAGVGGVNGKGIARPPLTQSQRMFMVANDWERYNSGQAVEVPLIDDPFELLKR